MPAKKRDEPKYKPFVGRIFTLRNHETIPTRFENLPNKRDLAREKFGEAVFVLNEDNSRAQVTTVDGHPAWIPKFYLHKEISNTQFEDCDNMADVIDELLSIATNIKQDIQEKENFIETEAFMSYAEVIENIANTLRQKADKFNPINAEVVNGKSE